MMQIVTRVDAQGTKPVLDRESGHDAERAAQRITQPARPIATGSRTFADRLRGERRRWFVGREDELAIFNSVLVESRYSLVFLTGQAGVGKTSILFELERMCVEAPGLVASLDAPALSRATQDEKEELRRRVLGLLDASNRAPPSTARPTLIIDSYERLGANEQWLLTQLIPNLPDDVLLVFASREPPPTRLSVDPAWARLILRVDVPPFSASEAAQLLDLHDIPATAQASLIGFASGYPLALALGAELLRRTGGEVLTAEHERDLRESIAHALCIEGHSTLQQMALDISAVAQITNLPLLERAMLSSGQANASQAQELFGWLGSQRFIERYPAGLAPHALARATLVARLRDDPEKYEAIYRRVREFLVNEVAVGSQADARFGELLFLDRDRPLGRDLATSDGRRRAPTFEAAEAEDLAYLVDLVRELEGDESAELFRTRFQLDPHAFEVTRSQRVEAFWHSTTLSGPADIKLTEQDPAARLAKQFVLKNPLQDGAKAVFFRWFLSREDYQRPRGLVLGISARQARLLMSIDRLAYALCVIRDPGDWEDLWEAAHAKRQLVGTFMMGPHRYSVIAFSYQERTLREWLVGAWLATPSEAAEKPIDSAREQKQKLKQRVARLGKSMKLTPREVQILEMLSLGGAFEEIAAQLNISTRTVKFHQENLLRKTGSSSRLDLFRKLL